MANKLDCDISLQSNNREVPAFKQVHTRYRRRPENPDRLDDLEEMVDFAIGGDSRTWKLPTVNDSNCYNGPIYGFHDFPGFLFAPQALSLPLQEQLAFEAVSRYCEAPHRTNMDGAPPTAASERTNTTTETMWNVWKQEQQQEQQQQVRKSIRRQPNRSLRKLSWSTLGYHYDWTRRCYDPSVRSPVPVELQKLANVFARTAQDDAIQSSSSQSQQSSFSYTASAIIVNYYHTKSNMGGHKDDLELALDKALVSISLGRPAVFLLGGRELEDPRIVPMIVRPGDVVIMGGESRLCYHSMARLLPAAVAVVEEEQKKGHQVSLERIFGQDAAATSTTLGERDREALSLFLSDHRINMNVRQVYPDDRYGK